MIAVTVGETAQFQSALASGDVVEVRRLLKELPALLLRINEPISDFGARPVHLASKNPEMMDVLLEFGADINLRTAWEKGPFTVLDSAPEDAARYFISCGAVLTAHAAARLGWIDELRSMLDTNPQVVHEKGGDGQRPLHFAKTVEIVDLLLERGAEIDARCDDHLSTAAQYALAERPEVCQHLLSRGAKADIFMPARLGDDTLAVGLIAEDPKALEARINLPGYEPVPPFNIYCWSLGWCLSPHEVAIKFGHTHTLDLLLDQSPPKVRLLIACTNGDEQAAREVSHANPNLVNELTTQDHTLLTYSMFYNRVAATKLMLSLGFDPMARGVDGGTLAHVAAWHGNVEVIKLLLGQYRSQIDLNAKDTAHNGTPLNWAQHGSTHSFIKGGDYAAVIDLLSNA